MARPASEDPSRYVFQPAAAPLAGHDGYATARSVIGDALRIPVVWCQFGSCIARFTDAAALGESDVRSRAVTAGWRQDALGRLACPGCVQHDPTFMVVYRLVVYQRARRGAEPSLATALHAAANPPELTRLSEWDAEQLPRLNLVVTAEPEPGRLAWWRHRDVGRHR
jgi:hypothetical protein